MQSAECSAQSAECGGGSIGSWTLVGRWTSGINCQILGGRTHNPRRLAARVCLSWIIACNVLIATALIGRLVLGG